MYPDGGIVSAYNRMQSSDMCLRRLVVPVLLFLSLTSCGDADPDDGAAATEETPATDSLDSESIDTADDDGAPDEVSSSPDETPADDTTETAAQATSRLVIPVVRTEGTTAAFDTVVVSPSGDRVALLTGRGVGAEKLEIFDTATGESVGVIADAGAMNMGWNDAGLIVAYDESSEVVRSWNPDTLTVEDPIDPDAPVECGLADATFEPRSNAFFSIGNGFVCRVDATSGATVTAGLPDADVGREGTPFPRPGAAELLIEYNKDGGGVIRSTLDGVTLAVLDSQPQDRYLVHAIGSETVLTIGGGVAVFEPSGAEIPGVDRFTGSSAGGYFLHNADVGTIYDAGSGDAVVAVNAGSSPSWSADDTTLAILTEAGIEIYSIP